MDIQSITDVKELKVLAYDAIATKEYAERNLSIINQRITELSQQELVEKSKTVKSKVE